MTQEKWECVHEWLSFHLDSRTPEEVAGMFLDLAHKIDHDTLEDYFKDHLNADGFWPEDEVDNEGKTR